MISGVLVAGLGARLFMRIAGASAPDRAQGAGTEAGFTVGEVTLAGTIELIIFVGFFAGIAGAVFYAAFRPWLGWAGKWRGAIFGVVLFAIGSATSDVLNPDNIDFIVLGNGALLVSLIVALFIGYGVMIEWLFKVLDRRMPLVESANTLFKTEYVGTAIIGLLAAVGFVGFSLFSTQGCDCDPPLLASTFVVIVAVGTLLWWASGIWRSQSWAASLAPILGFLGLVGATVFGLWRAVSDSVDIIT